MGFRVGWVSFGWVLIGYVSTGLVDSGLVDSVYRLLYLQQNYNCSEIRPCWTLKEF